MQNDLLFDNSHGQYTRQSEKAGYGFEHGAGDTIAKKETVLAD